MYPRWTLFPSLSTGVKDTLFVDFVAFTISKNSAGLMNISSSLLGETLADAFVRAALSCTKFKRVVVYFA